MHELRDAWLSQKNAYSPLHFFLGVFQAPSDKLCRSCLGKKDPWDEAINSITPTWSKYQVVPQKTKRRQLVLLMCLISCHELYITKKVYGMDNSYTGFNKTGMDK